MCSCDLYLVIKAQYRLNSKSVHFKCTYLHLQFNPSAWGIYRSLTLHTLPSWLIMCTYIITEFTEIIAYGTCRLRISSQEEDWFIIRRGLIHQQAWHWEDNIKPLKRQTKIMRFATVPLAMKDGWRKTNIAQWWWWWWCCCCCWWWWWWWRREWLEWRMNEFTCLRLLTDRTRSMYLISPLKRGKVEGGEARGRSHLLHLWH